MRIAITHIWQETCSFSPIVTTLDTFRRFGLIDGDDMLSRLRGIGSVGGFLAEAEDQGFAYTPVPLLAASAGPGGPLTAGTLEHLEGRLTTALRRALPVDGVYCSLHGAAVAENEPDVEGYLLSRIREIVGPDVPIVASFDHHGNVTRRMIEQLDGAVAHRTQPHEPFETGRLAARQLLAVLRNELDPRIAWRKIPMVVHQEQFPTNRPPSKTWFDRARAYEAEPHVVSVSPFPMQPWLDVPEGGWATVVVTNGRQELADRVAEEHARMAWEMRERFWVFDSVPVEEAVRRATTAPPGLAILSDTGDAVFAGAPGDSVHILRELLRQRVDQTALVPVVDPDAVTQAIAAGIGRVVTVELGGKLAKEFSDPMTVTAIVTAIGGGPIAVEFAGLESFDMGRAVLLEAGPVKIVVSEREGVGGNHPAVYQHFGLDPANARYAVLKTANNWQYYATWTSTVVRVDSPGPSMSHLERFNWRQLPRPIFPLDPDASFR